MRSMCVPTYRCPTNDCRGELILDEETGAFCARCKRKVGLEEVREVITDLPADAYTLADSIVTHIGHIQLVKRQATVAVRTAFARRITNLPYPTRTQWEMFRDELCRTLDAI